MAIDPFVLPWERRMRKKSQKVRNVMRIPDYLSFPKVTSELYRAGGMHRISLDERSYARHISWLMHNEFVRDEDIGPFIMS